MGTSPLNRPTAVSGLVSDKIVTTSNADCGRARSVGLRQPARDNAAVFTAKITHNELFEAFFSPNPFSVRGRSSIVRRSK